MMHDVVLVSAARPAVGDFGDCLAGLTPTKIGMVTATAAIRRAGEIATAVDQAFFGSVIQTEPCGAIIATKRLYELKRVGGRPSAATMCIGGGEVVALIVENLVR